MIYNIINRIVVVFGGLLLAIVGRNKFYRLAQDRSGFIGRIASAFCQGHAGRVCQNYDIYMKNINKDRISDVSLKYYSDDTLHGFADESYELRGDGQPLLEQQRALILPLVENQIDRIKPKTVLEIGVGNGDIIAYLAGKYTNIEFVGVDLSVVNALKKHQAPNLRFVQGYALDLLRQGSLNADIVFGSSTFCVFTPLELEAYLSALSDIKAIAISEPVTFGNKHTDNDEVASRHMDLYMWWHNYLGYLKKHSFTVDVYKTVPFSLSHSPNCEVILISGHR